VLSASRVVARRGGTIFPRLIHPMRLKDGCRVLDVADE
jgi:hypothetical protein